MRPAFLLLAAGATCLSAAIAGPLRVDLNPDNGRGDVLSPGIQNWPIAAGREVSRDFGPLTITLRRPGSPATGLIAGWWKAGYDSGAVLASDGVTVAGNERDGQIEMVVRGLSPGRHAIVTYHNHWEMANLGPMSVFVDGVQRKSGIRPTTRASNDDDCTTAFVEVEAKAGQDVVLRFQPEESDASGRVVLNGFAIDVPDPARQAARPQPSNGDEHVAENPVLSWRPAANAARHRLYLGTSRASLKQQSEQVSIGWRTRDLSPHKTYFWRVDEVDHDGTVTAGEVWSFRVRRLAFPGAEGHGRFAIGGRGGRVLEVTHIEDSGPGSLRAAVEAEGPRTVVFRVGGTIRLQSKLVIRHPYLTIAGQTAPGDGICVRGYTFGCLGTHDVIIRHLRIRVGDEAGVTMDGTGFASTDHAIMDHCSVSWSIDEAVSSRGAGNITFQRNIVAEALNIANHRKYQLGKGHSFAGSISGNIGSFHHNLLAHCAGRNWSLAGGLTRGNKFAGRLDIRNNVVYNWQHRTTDGGVKALNFVNNYYIPGPATKVFHLLKPDAGNPDDPQQYYLSGNAMVGRPEFEADNWVAGSAIVDPQLIAQIKLERPFCEPFISTDSAADAYASVLADVGANVPRLDDVDRRILHDVIHRQATSIGSRGKLPGIIDSQTDVGGWPMLRNGEPPPDTDHDGMPDEWELSQSLNPRDGDDGNSVRADGYTNLEAYLNRLVGASK